eukprot:TRINITY_DN4812_c0_g2_i1.p1 TRINITY_DN4812_c0_g2~~TRINITY_DN4812_c0_g2_i1.p1  ORF type:complete len:335 (+),score=82.50 TRINITY_DN4812_c0_g2_i1:789-1793(+)
MKTHVLAVGDMKSSTAFSLRLDVNKIRENLADLMNPEEIIAILKSIRANLKGRRKTEYLSLITEKKLFDEGDINLLQILIDSKNTDLMQATLKLISSLSESRPGRRYIIERDSFLLTLVNFLGANAKVTSYIRNKSVKIIQKLSLSKQTHKLLIENRVIDFLLQSLNEGEAGLDQSLEYSIALLMNMSLKKEGRVIFEQNMEASFTLIEKYSDHKDSQIKSFVNGVLFSLLRSQAFLQEARKRKLDEKLETIMEKSKKEEALRVQLEYIIAALQNEEENKEEVEDEEEENEDEQENSTDEGEDQTSRGKDQDKEPTREDNDTLNYLEKRYSVSQ